MSHVPDDRWGGTGMSVIPKPSNVSCLWGIYRLLGERRILYCLIQTRFRLRAGSHCAVRQSGGRQCREGRERVMTYCESRLSDDESHVLMLLMNERCGGGVVRERRVS